MILSQASEWTSSSDDKMLFDEMDQEVIMFSNVLLMFSTLKTF
jgi:hypothetical protein